MRADSMRLLPRISTTVSVGTRTSLISFWRSVSRMRAFRLSRTFFSCPEYVWRMNHCCIRKLFPSGEAQQPCYFLNQPIQPYDQARQSLIHSKQVNGEKDNGDDRDDGRVLHVFEIRPGDPSHLGPDLVQEFPQTL